MVGMHVDCREWQHSETWWPGLFQHHQPIQWDDYDKDYSDLPLQVSLAQSPSYLLFHVGPTALCTSLSAVLCNTLAWVTSMLHPYNSVSCV